MKKFKIYFFVLILIIILATVMGSRQTDRFETFSDKQLSLINFLTVSEAREVFLSDAFDYHKDYSRHESIAKTKISNLPDIGWHAVVRQAYLDNVQEFSEKEKNGIQDFITTYSYSSRLPWKFIKMADHMDFTFPYTLGDCIVLPTRLVRSIANKTSPKSDFTTLCHENIHILQRFNPGAYKKYYESSWNYIFDPNLEIPYRLRQQTVINPDGYEKKGGWIATVESGEYYYCLCLNDNLELSKRAYKIEGSLGRRRVDDHRWFPLGNFSRYQHGVINCYHPNEEYAYLTSQYHAEKYFSR